MKRRIVDFVGCPACRERVNLHVFLEKEVNVPAPIAAPRCASYCAMHNVDPNDQSNKQGELDCNFCYEKEIVEGLLCCPSCKSNYPIIAGVPRLIRNAYAEYREFYAAHRSEIESLSPSPDMHQQAKIVDASIFDRRSNDSFGLQWEAYQYEDKTWFKDDVQLRRGEFLYSMNLSEKQVRGALLLDVGCGNGKLTASISHYGCEVIGMDLSHSVERAAANCAQVAKEYAPFVHFVQGNIMEPPFAEGSFDHIHTSGVLHHTPDPERALASFLTLVRPGGRAYVQLYRKREAWVRIPNSILRVLTTRIPVRLLYRICYALVPLHTAAVVMVAHFRGEKTPIRNASRRERAVSLFDHFSPRYQFRYTPEQMKEILRGAGGLNIKDVTLDNEKRHMVAFVCEVDKSNA